MRVVVEVILRRLGNGVLLFDVGEGLSQVAYAPRDDYLVGFRVLQSGHAAELSGPSGGGDGRELQNMRLVVAEALGVLACGFAQEHAR